MKKIFIAVMAIAAMTFAACDTKTAGQSSDNDSIAPIDTTVLEESSVIQADEDITALTAALESDNSEDAQVQLSKVQEYVQKLQAEGKIDEASAYLAKIQEFIANNEEKVNALTKDNSTLSAIVSAVKAIPTSAEAAAEGVADDAANKAADIKEKANEKINEAKDAVKEKVNEKVNEEVEKAKEKANEKLNEAANKAADDVKKKLGF